AGVEDRLADHVDAAVRACSHADLLDGDAVACRESLVQAERATVRIAVEVGGGADERLLRAREPPKRAFVRRGLDDVRQPELPLHVLDGLPRLVRRQTVDGAAEKGIGGVLERFRHDAGPYRAPTPSWPGAVGRVLAQAASSMTPRTTAR